MGWISTIFVHRVVDLASQGLRGGSTWRRELLSSVDVDHDASSDPGGLIADTDFFRLLERVAAERQNGRSIPVRVGASMRCDHYGAFGLAFKSAVDLEGSYRRVERYGKVVASIANFHLVPGNGTAFLEVLRDGEGRPGARMTRELAVAAATAISREVCQRDFTPEAIHFAHDAPTDLSEHEAHFRCPIRYGAERDALEVTCEALRRPNRLGDTGISAFFDAHLERELKGLDDVSVLGRRVRVRICEVLSEGAPTLSQVARRLGMSGRTLQRRLAESGLAYKDIVADARQELAERLLSETDYPLADIAFLTGFSEQSTFARAFKRRTGQTPAAYRRSV